MKRDCLEPLEPVPVDHHREAAHLETRGLSGHHHTLLQPVPQQRRLAGQDLLLQTFHRVPGLDELDQQMELYVRIVQLHS